MELLIIIFGALTLLAGIVIIINPEIMFGYLRNNLDKPALHIVASSIRLVLGTILIYNADVSRFPVIIEILGWFSILAAVVIIIMGRPNFTKLMVKAFSLVKTFGRFAGVVAFTFGAFLIYAFIL